MSGCARGRAISKHSLNVLNSACQDVDRDDRKTAVTVVTRT
jgi:hypothetical protein